MAALAPTLAVQPEPQARWQEATTERHDDVRIVIGPALGVMGGMAVIAFSLAAVARVGSGPKPIAALNRNRIA